MVNIRYLLAAVIAAALASTSLAGLAATVSPVQLTSALHWRSVGHYVGGRVVAVTGVAQQPNHYYMGAVGGGVWESTDYGIDWRNISDKYFDNNNIGAIAVAPSDPKVIYVGTGETDIRNTFLTGDGMYKSVDAGKTWKKTGLAATHTIGRIIVDPGNPDVVYATSMGHVFVPNPERGVFKSTDGGQTWKKILYVNPQTGAIDLVMDPSNPQVLYAAMWQASRQHWTFSSGGPGSGIYKSTDGGATWSNITHGSGLPTGIFGRVGLAIAPSNTQVMYAVVQANHAGKAGGLFRSEDAGKSWKLVNTSMDLTQRAYYYSTVFVDPKNPDTIYLPQVEALWVSHDGGKTIAKLKTPHGDNHDLWINPNDPLVMIEGNDGGATVTRDGGKNWSTVDNQPTGQFYHANLDNQFPYHIYGAQQDEGAFEGPSAVASGGIPGVWTRVQGGESSWVVPQPGEPWITYANGYFTLFYRGNRRLGLSQSISVWPDFGEGNAASQLKYRFAWIHHPILFAPGNPHELLVGAQYVLKSMDRGDSWTRISPDLTRHDQSKEGFPGEPLSHDASSAEIYDTISALAVSPRDDNVIWAGSDDGLVHVTRDGGAHWDAVRPKDLPEWITITGIEASHTDPGTAYFAASHYQWDDFKPYLYKTTDYGKHWTAIQNGLPGDQYVESVREDPSAPNLLFAGTSESVFMSLDAGAHWLPLALNLPPVRVSDIAIQSEQHAVVLATHGRAFWTLDNLQFLEQLSVAHVSTDSAYLFKPQQTWLVTRRSGGEAAAAPNEGANLPAGAAVFFYLPANYDGQTPVKLSFTTADGKTINEFTLPLPDPKTHKAGKPLHAGMNRFQWNLRYPDAVEVKGFFTQTAGELATPEGPTVVPGTYDAVLTAGGNTVKQPFTVKLDPRLQTTQQQLQARFDLLMQINGAMSSLDTTLNKAISTRDQLQAKVANGKTSSARAKEAVAALDHDIGSLVELRIQSGEGNLVYTPLLRSHLSYIADNIGDSFTPLRSVQQEVATMLLQEAQTGEASLHADIAKAEPLLAR